MSSTCQALFQLFRRVIVLFCLLTGCYSINKATSGKKLGKTLKCCALVQGYYHFFFFFFFHSFKNKFIERLFVKSNQSEKFLSESSKSTVLAGQIDRITIVFEKQNDMVLKESHTPASWVTVEKRVAQEGFLQETGLVCPDAAAERPVNPAAPHPFNRYY